MELIGGRMISPLIQKLELFGPLPPGDRILLDEVVSQPRRVAAHRDLIREGERPSDVHLVIEGLACRYNLLADGRRSVSAYLVPGDFCNPHVFILGAMDHGIATVSPCTIVDIPRGRILEMTERPAIARALWWATLVDEATLRAWLVNMGRRDAEGRIAHLFCELHLRLKHVGLVDNGEFALPVTQSDLADTVGLSAVHVNRLLMSLRSQGFVSFKGGRIVIADLDRLSALAGFNPNYLHLDTIGSEPALLPSR